MKLIAAFRCLCGGVSRAGQRIRWNRDRTTQWYW